VIEKVARSSANGQLFAGQYVEELELAEKIQQFVPCAELMRFCLSGSEAVHAALCVARAVTGRTKFLRFEGHYHGWLDSVAFGINAPSLDALGNRNRPTPVPWTEGLPPSGMDEALVLPWNDLDSTLYIVSSVTNSPGQAIEGQTGD
jgi:glutamate-1-semialdehyde 2,1-aminomutase